jgi:hypothetical protein
MLLVSTSNTFLRSITAKDGKPFTGLHVLKFQQITVFATIQLAPNELPEEI